MKKFAAFFLEVQSPLSSLFTLWMKGRPVGRDPYGNRYYTGKARKGYGHERRWVRYAGGAAEASRVPPEYHGWLHHQTDIFPDEDAASFRKPWMKPHEQNLTGTTLAYRPAGHPLNGRNRPTVTGDYEAWTPDYPD